MDEQNLIAMINDESMFVNSVEFGPDGIHVSYQEKRLTSESTAVMSGITIIADSEKRQIVYEELQEFLRGVVDEALTDLRLYNEEN